MSWYDRVTLGTLTALMVVLVGMLCWIGHRVADVSERTTPTTIVPPTTTPPVTCVVDDSDTNWAARFGVEDRSCT